MTEKRTPISLPSDYSSDMLVLYNREPSSAIRVWTWNTLLTLTDLMTIFISKSHSGVSNLIVEDEGQLSIMTYMTNVTIPAAETLFMRAGGSRVLVTHWLGKALTECSTTGSLRMCWSNWIFSIHKESFTNKNGGHHHWKSWKGENQPRYKKGAVIMNKTDMVLQTAHLVLR